MGHVRAGGSRRVRAAAQAQAHRGSARGVAVRQDGGVLRLRAGRRRAHREDGRREARRRKREKDTQGFLRFTQGGQGSS